MTGCAAPDPIPDGFVVFDGYDGGVETIGMRGLRELVRAGRSARPPDASR